jgi:predicted phage terminase large subunit-like protein
VDLQVDETLSRLIKTRADAVKTARLSQALARSDFWYYRKVITPRMFRPWWQQDVAQHLQQFYLDMLRGRRPKLILASPPQHGKSKQVIDFISWLAGNQPDWKIVFASYSSALGLRTNSELQRIWTSPEFRSTFSNLLIPAIGELGPHSARNATTVDFVGYNGSFYNTTVEGQITGQGLEVGVIDDPIKGRAEAQSKPVRDKVWTWITDDFFPRFAQNAGLIMIMTRWHVDDPVGRWLERHPETKILKYQAIAEEDEEHRKAGVALFPEHKPIEFLLERKALMTEASWQALYQQSPIVTGGGMFPVDKFELLPHAPDRREIKRSVRYIDKAGTKDGGAYTAMVLMHRMRDDTYVISSVRRGQWSALEREKMIKQTAELDRDLKLMPPVHIWVEQEPGSGGLESADSTVRLLTGFSVRKDKVTGSKEVRADPYAAQVQGGNVRLVAGEWNRAFLEEHELFPASKYKDQVDAAAGAFAKLAGTSYDSSLSWVG